MNGGSFSDKLAYSHSLTPPPIPPSQYFPASPTPEKGAHAPENRSTSALSASDQRPRLISTGIMTLSAGREGRLRGIYGPLFRPGLPRGLRSPGIRPFEAYGIPASLSSFLLTMNHLSLSFAKDGAYSDFTAQYRVHSDVRRTGSDRPLAPRTSRTANITLRHASPIFCARP